MSFHTGIQVYEKDEGRQEGDFLEAAVKCWFTASGKALPLSMKIRDKEGQILYFFPIRVLSQERLQYAGIPAWKYKCRIWEKEQPREILLFFYPEEGVWRVSRYV